MAGLELPRFRELPRPWRATLAVFLCFLGGGYFVAQLNVLAQNELVDGRPGLSWRDLLLRYHGDWVVAAAGQPLPSRMLEMIQGAMRQYFNSDEDFQALFGWLRSGAPRGAFATGPDPTPHDVLFKCLRCHAADSRESIGAKAPFGPDRFTVEYDSVAGFTLAAPPGATRVWRPPNDWRELVMSMHAHVFSVPMFLLALAALFLWNGWPAHTGWRTLLAAAPLALFLIDIACWPLARLPGPVGVACVALIPLSAAGFGAAYLVQWCVVMAALWRGPARRAVTPARTPAPRDRE